MPANEDEIHYKVWASDNVVYGPVLLETLLEWVADGRVLSDTWVFSQEVNSWKPAKSLPPLGDALAAYHASHAPLPTPTELGYLQAHGAGLPRAGASLRPGIATRQLPQA